MIHVMKNAENGKVKPTLLLLHGTGGDENDMFPIAEMIDAQAPALGVRGNVSENGMPRFFRRLGMGIFDEKDLVERTHELNSFVTEASNQYHFDRDNVIAVGYSNGANIAASLLYHDKDALKGAILFHPMVPLRNIELPDLSGVKVFIGAGANDPMVPKENTEELIQSLQNAGAEVEVFWHNSGHSLTPGEVQQAIGWYQNL